ncbi:MAG: protein tyrosine phosphatase family protein [Planctomycetota bacterium]
MRAINSLSVASIVGITMLASSGWSHGAYPQERGEHHAPVRQTEWLEEFNTTVVDLGGGVWMGGQPSEAALRGLHEEGFETVICLRAQREIDNREWVPYDMEAVAGELGMAWVHIPMSGDYGPDLLEQFTSAIHEAEGRVLVHCTVAWRASHIWGAYLMGSHGYSFDEAWQVVQQIYAESNSPIERLTGIKLKSVLDTQE